MFNLKLIVIYLGVISSCKASGIGHFAPAALPVVRTLAVTRYAPFYNFPTGARSIHAYAPIAAAGSVDPAIASALPAPPPLYPSPLAAPVLPHAAFPAPVLPAPAIASPISVPLFSPALPKFLPSVQALPRFAPAIPAFPAFNSGPFIQTAPSFQATPVIRHALPAPIFASAHVAAPVPYPVAAPAPLAVARTPLAYPAAVPAHLHLHNQFLNPAPVYPSPLIKHLAWK